MRLRVIGTLVGLLVGVAAAFGVAEFVMADYSGKEVFNTEEEYSEFKLAIASEDVHFEDEDIFVLASEPPVVVQFHVSVPHNYVFEYGNKESAAFLYSCVVLLFCSSGLLVGEFVNSRFT